MDVVKLNSYRVVELLFFALVNSVKGLKCISLSSLGTEQC
jgi:hypothetical protein